MFLLFVKFGSTIWFDYNVLSICIYWQGVGIFFRNNEEAPAPIDLNEPEFFNDDLTDEDRKYLTIKWGKTYRPYEWVQLEKLYQEMMAAFDIVTPAHEDYLKLICKTSLKCH